MKRELEQILETSEAFLVEGVLNKNKLAELARQYNPELLNVLLGNEKIAQQFFTKLQDGVLVFKKDVFLQFLNNKEFLPDSFTAYKTKIGLGTADGNYLSENKEVVLNFPYKDCVIEGGQTKDDTKRQEIFFNEILAPAEINRLLDDKVLSNFKRYDKDGEQEVEELKDTDNLIIKGNNLLALHSLKKRFGGQVKLIYIDPPYNTGSDSFGYNDNFNRSTWLTFMKNRLTIAKDLLRTDGVIIVQISFHEFPYLRVMMDELFTEENEKNINVYLPDDITITRSEGHEGGLKSMSIRGSIREKNSSGRFYVSHLEGLIDKYPEGTIFTVPNMGDDGREFRIFELPKNGNKNGFYYPGKPIGSDYTLKPYPNFVDFVQQYNSVNSEGDVSFRNGKKPEEYIRYYLEMFTKEGDIVLDYHLGSGTTAAVAHKMNRQYIGIEQMDYIETVSVERLKKVIDGEQRGISKDVNWNGGGSFVYCELKNDAQDFKNSVLEATSSEVLSKLFEQAKKSSFLSYRVDPKKLKKQEFEKISLAEQKQILLELVDNNNLYVNYTEIDDSDYDITKQEKELNRAFYGEE